MKKLFILLATGLLTVGCSDYFDKKGDDNTIPASRFYGDEGAFLSALTDIYTQLRAETLYGGTLNMTMMNFLSHEFQPRSATEKAAYDRNYSNTALKEQLHSMTQAAYKAVTSCNKIIEEAENTDIVFFNPGQREVVLGECYALRAAMQFDLLRLYHPLPTKDNNFTGLPYITKFGQKKASKMTTAQFMEAVKADLLKAEKLLSSSDPILKSSNSSLVAVGRLDRRLRTLQLNYYAVKAIQARVALWSGDYQAALQCAEAVFAHNRNVDSRHQLFYYVTPGTYGSDYEFSREYIFGLATRPEGFAKLCDQRNKDGLTVTERLHTIYPNPADIRYRAWFKATDNRQYALTKFGSETLLSGYVYSQMGVETGLPATIPYIKIGEVALIAAESLTQLNRFDEAITYIKALEDSKNIDNAALLQSGGHVSKDALLKIIHEEYERDLFGEGQLFYLYKRLGQAESPSLPE